MALEVEQVAIFKAAKNFNVIGMADFSDPNGYSLISATIHGASMLLRLSENWDWFINLDAHDYPLVTQNICLNFLLFCWDILCYAAKMINLIMIRLVQVFKQWLYRSGLELLLVIWVVFNIWQYKWHKLTALR